MPIHQPQILPTSRQSLPVHYFKYLPAPGENEGAKQLSPRAEEQVVGTDHTVSRYIKLPLNSASTLFLIHFYLHLHSHYASNSSDKFQISFVAIHRKCLFVFSHVSFFAPFIDELSSCSNKIFTKYKMPCSYRLSSGSSSGVSI